MAAASMLGYSLIVSAPSSASAKGVGKILGKPEKTFGGRFVNDGKTMEKLAVECDVLVAGGGLAGVCAALSAARHGKKLCLFRTGRGSAEIRVPKSRCTRSA